MVNKYIFVSCFQIATYMNNNGTLAEQAEGESYMVVVMRLKQLLDIEGARDCMEKNIRKLPSQRALAVMQSLG
jgi:hypothetical protein